MRTIHTLLVLVSLSLTQQVFADSLMQKLDASDRPCAPVVKACLDAGFVRERSEDKGIWHNCMEPALLGKTVEHVQLDASVVKTCRQHKITELKMQLKQLENVKS